MFQHGLIIYNYITFYFLYLSIIPIWDHPRHRSARGCGALRGSGATLDFNAFSTLTEHPTWSSRNGCETVVDLAWITMEHMWNKYGTYKHIWWTRVIDGICLLFSHNFQINPNQDVSKPSFFSFFFHILGGWRSIPGLSGVVYHGALVWILLRLSQGQLTYVTGALMPPWETGML